MKTKKPRCVICKERRPINNATFQGNLCRTCYDSTLRLARRIIPKERASAPKSPRGWNEIKDPYAS